MVKEIKIGVVGSCGTGKSELVAKLKERGYQAHHIAQEHSYAPKMWKEITDPDYLIFLEVSFTETLKRKNFNWTEQDYQDQLQRLGHAKEHADLLINTDDLTPDQVFNLVLEEIEV